jgi:translocation and assembly module TamB
MRINLERGRVQLSAASLLKLNLRILELSLAGLTVGLPEPELEPLEPPSPLTVPKEIELPVRFVVDRFVLRDLTMQRSGETLLELDRIALRLEAGPEVLRVAALELEMSDMEVWMDAELWPSGGYPLQVQARWCLALPEPLAAGLETGHAEGELTVVGDLLGSLEVIHRLQAGTTLETRLGAEDLLGTPQVRLDSNWIAFHYRLDPETVVAIDAGDIALRGGLEAWTARMVTGAHLTGLPKVRLEAALNGSGEHAVIEAFRLRSDAGQVDLQGRLGWDETLTWYLQAGIRGLYAPDFGLEPNITIEKLSLVSSGSLPRAADLALKDRLLAITGDLEIHELRADVARQELQGGGRFAVERGSVRFDDLLLRLGPDGSFRIAGEAELGAKTPYRLAVTADALDLGLLVPDRQLVMDRMRLQAEGLLGLETGSIEAAIGLTDLSARLDGLEISARAELNLTETEADVRNLEVFLPADGLLSVKGRVAYGTGIGWDLRISGRGIDPGVFAPDLAGRLDVELASRGAMPPDQELQAEVELAELRGTLRGQPVEGIAVLAVNGQQIRIDRLDMGMGANRLTASGHIDERLALELTLDAPELERILPDLAGRIQLDARLSGTMVSPRVAASAEGSGLRYAEFELDAFHLRLDAGLDPDAPAELDLRLSGIRAAGQHVEEVRAGAEGRASAHRLTLAVDAADLGRLAVKASGGYEMEQTRWRGRLERLDIAQPLAGDWTLREPVLVSASPVRATLGSSAWDASVPDSGSAATGMRRREDRDRPPSRPSTSPGCFHSCRPTLPSKAIWRLIFAPRWIQPDTCARK